MTLILWLVAAWLSRPVPALGPFSLLLLLIVIGQISSLFLVTVARTPRLRVATRLVAEMLEHWHRYERDRLYPPWVFQSPIGSQATRTLLMGAAIASMSIAIVPLFLVEVVLPAGYSSAPWSGKSGCANMGLNTSCESASASLKAPASPTRAGH